MGTVHKIVYRPGEKPPKIPDLVYVQFQDYLGQSALPDVEKVVPIDLMTSDWIWHGKPCSRSQIPLKAGDAITIHKSQGMSSICTLSINKMVNCCVNLNFRNDIGTNHH